jgi:cellulose synthase operon protein YhjQ
MSLNLVAVIACKGGVGKTSVAANLGALLNQTRDRHVLMTDFDPRNQLGLHFSMATTDLVGLAQATLDGRSWGQALHYRLDRVPFLPFGNLNDPQRIEFERILMENPWLIKEGLSDPALAEYEFALVDCAPGPSAYMQHVLSHALFCIVIVLADAASYATLPTIEQQLNQYCRRRSDFGGAWYLVNMMDESKRLSRDVKAALQGQLGSQLLPFVIHNDQAVRESLAFQRPVVDQSLHGQASADFRQLAAWVRQKYGELTAQGSAGNPETPIVAPRGLEPMPVIPGGG